MIAIPIIAKIAIVVISYLIHFKMGRFIKGLFLAAALWILIPGIDELIVFPLLASTGLMRPIVLVAYYALGLILLGIWFII